METSSRTKYAIVYEIIDANKRLFKTLFQRKSNEETKVP